MQFTWQPLAIALEVMPTKILDMYWQKLFD
jgi:hypothetical protein